jgi:O-antigen/teichoic acid export membrane protein
LPDLPDLPRRARTATGARSIVRSTVTLVAGQGGAQVLSFVRNVIVARLLGPEHLGVAATFLVVLTLVEVVSDLSGDKMLVQADDGDEESFQAVVQFVTFLRGLGLGLLLLLMAWPVPTLFGVPEARWAFICLAAYPVLRGAVHLDTVRWQRELRFGPHVAVDTAVHVGLTIAAWPLCAWLGTYAAVLWILLAQAGVLTIGAHLLARRRYRWRWETATVRRIASFSWPLVINGGLIFVIVQGDQLLVGTCYSMTELGLYAVAFSLTAAPTLLLSRISNALLLPVLSRRRNVREAFEAACERGGQVLAALAVALATGFLLAGPTLAEWIYGAAYTAAGSIMGWLGVMQAIRLVRMAPTQAAIALGDTRNAMLSNCWRMSALAGALPAALAGADVVWIAAAGGAGEMAALVASITRLRRRQGVDATIWLRSLLPAAAVVAMTMAGRAAGAPAWALATGLAVAAIVAMARLGAGLGPALRGGDGGEDEMAAAIRVGKA